MTILLRRVAVAGAVVTICGLTAVLDSACSRKPELAFELVVPRGTPEPAEWVEIGVFRAGCPAPAQLGGGIPPGGAVARVAFRVGDKAPPALGDLPRASYAFAAVARSESCAVVATGCSAIDVGDTDTIRVELQATTAPLGACALGAVCQTGRCVPGNDIRDPSVGAGCSMQLLGAGPLANPLPVGGGNIDVSAPAVTATPTGFLIAYREQSSTQGVARLTMIPVDEGGGARSPVHETLLARCASPDDDDSTSITFRGDTGLVAVARPSCGTQTPGLNSFAVAADGVILEGGRGTDGFPNLRRLALTRGRSLAADPDSDGYLLALLQDNQASLGRVKGVSFDGAVGDFGGAPPMTGAQVVTTDKVVALLAQGQGSTPINPDPPADDAGAGDGGRDGGTTPRRDAGSSGATLRLQMAAAGTNLANLPPPTEFDGSWGTLGVEGTTAVVVSDGTGVGRPLAFRIYTLGKDIPYVDGYAPEGIGKVLFADVAVRQNRMFFAVEQPGSINVVAYSGFATTPALLREVILSQDPRVPSISTVRDGHVAVAASDTRVAVAWTTAKNLTENDATGGYAVFACRTP